ncbi:hypothetical protein XPA_006834 [Xanthoria parietina]
MPVGAAVGAVLQASSDPKLLLRRLACCTGMMSNLLRQGGERGWGTSQLVALHKCLRAQFHLFRAIPLRVQPELRQWEAAATARTSLPWMRRSPEVCLSYQPRRTCYK